MDRLNRLRGEPGGSRDSTLDTTSPPSEGFLTANESSSKYFSLSEVDSSFDISPIKDVSLNSTAADATEAATDPAELISNLSPINKKSDPLDNFRIGKLSEAANILSGGVDIFEDNDHSYDGHELVIDDNVTAEPEETATTEVEETATAEAKETEAIPSKDTEVVLQIKGRSVSAIDIGNGLYLYRQEGEQEELAAVQIIDPNQDPPEYKFLKVRENKEGNLEVYEEFEVCEPSPEPPVTEEAAPEMNPHVPIRDINKVISEPSSSKAAERSKLTPKESDPQASTSTEANKTSTEMVKDQTEGKSESNFNGKMKFNEARKSPVIGAFTPMTYHSTPNKEGIPLTKTMVDMQLHPSRHSDNAKKTIEVNNETNKKLVETSSKAEVSTAEANESSDNVVKADDKVLANEGSNVTVPKVKENLEVCNAVESTQNEVKKDFPKSDNVDKGSETTIIVSSLINDKLKQPDIEQVDSSEISSTTVEKDDIPVKSDTVEKEDKSANVESLVKTTAENKQETLSPEVKAETTAIAVPEIKLLPTSKVDLPPAEVKEVQPTGIEKNPLECKPAEIECTEKVYAIKYTSKTAEEAKGVTVGPKKIEEKSSTKTVNNMNYKAQVVDDKKEKVTAANENLELTLLNEGVEPIPTTIKEANLLTNKKEPAVKNNEVDLTKNTIEPASTTSTLTLPFKDLNALRHNNKIAGDLEPSEATPKLIEPKDTMTCDVKSSAALIILPISKQKSDIIKDKTINETLPEKEIKTDAVPKVHKKDESNKLENKNSSNDLIELNDLGVSPTQNKARLEKSLETDIIKLDQQLKTAQTKEENIKPEINKTVTAEKTIPFEQMIGKVKPTEMFVKAETKSEFVNRHVSKAVFIRSANPTEQNKATDAPVLIPESSNNAIQRPDVGKKDIPKVAALDESKLKSINNNAPCNVPFGKWTEANKQQYLNKIRETKIPTSNPNQLKQANDLNRRDVLKKIESQRQSHNIAAANAAKNLEIMLNHNKPSVKNENPIFVSKTTVKVDASTKIPMKTEVVNKPDSTRLTIGPNLTITPLVRPAEAPTAASPTLTYGKIEPAPYVAKKEFSIPNPVNIAKRETPLQYPYNLAKKDLPNNRNVTKREPATTSSANLILIPPGNASIITKKETSMPRATNLSKKDPVSYSKANITKVEIIAPPTQSNVTKKEIVITSNVKVATKDTVPSGVNLTKKEAPISVTKRETTTSSNSSSTKKETEKVDPAKDPNNPRPTNQDLIDKTIEDYLLSGPRPMTLSREAKEAKKEKEKAEKIKSPRQKSQSSKSKKVSPLDDIEMQMNALHGIPFIERPPHELPHRYSSDVKTYSKNETRSKVLPMSKVNKLPNLLPLQKTKDTKLKANDVDELSEEEIIEHEPITGDIELNKKKDSPKKLPVSQTVTQSTSPKKDNVITENDFDKFVRRNSITYENCITVNYDVNKQHNVVQSVVAKDLLANALHKGLPNTDMALQPQLMPQHQNKGISNSSRFVPIQPDDGYNANYHSKLQIAYQSALTAKQKNSPITVLEDKPVKVVFVDNNTEFVPSQLNVQGKELSPAKRVKEPEAPTQSSCDSMDSDVLDTAGGTKSKEGTKKHKHQRKQVLTPVEGPELELIEPNDLGLEPSPKKKRKTEDLSKTFSEKSYTKSVPKKTYILAHSTQINVSKDSSLPENQRPNNVTSAIDSLVKAAELLENQSENTNTTIDSQTSSQPTPVKRGRGRPRKYPLPDGAVEKSPKVPTPQKKPRIEKKYDTSSEGSSDDEMVRENWTMGKINEDIVCPICNKLFRSENVVFKHVKHCTGPSPNRSDGGKRSRDRRSQETDSKYRDESLDSMDLDMESQTTNKTSVSKDVSETTEQTEELVRSTPIQSRRISEKRDHVPTKCNETRKSLHKAKASHSTNNLVCEFCGKTFRQLSYLVSHKIQHQNDEIQKKDNFGKESASNNKTVPNVFSCEVCKKEFRKLHHLVQHRIIHNPPNMPTKLTRKSSADNSDKVALASNSDSSKTAEDQSAGFRCEPCDKSFRKLHHLVEHRETHDGINRQKNTSVTQNSVEKEKEKAPPPPQCDVCKKTFRKLHHLIEHKEQHADLNSEKSDDKSVKSALSTKDIIHECSLCYMVFPNEHSLMKHTVICQRKKRQSKQSKPETEDQTSQESTESVEAKPTEDVASKVGEEEKVLEKPEKIEMLEKKEVTSPKKIDVEVKNSKAVVDKPEKVETAKEKISEPPVKEVEIIPEKLIAKEETAPKAKPEVTNVTDTFTKPKPVVIDTIVIEDTPKKEKPSTKDKIGSSVTKRQKSITVPLPIVEENKPLSDEDEIRYMFNPNFKIEENVEEKTFMKVRGLKRNSLQIERPKSNLIKRRISLQHPPKVTRLKAKTEPMTPLKAAKKELLPATDSDDSDTVKYSFPTPVSEEAEPKPQPKVAEKTVRRKSIAERRKSLGGIAKRKSVGKMVSKSTKVIQTTAAVKKRLPEAGHRCDCGQLFSSAALLSRHTTLAHTPPRIRRRRSSPPPPLDVAKKSLAKQKTPTKEKDSRKSIAPASKTVSTAASRKSTVPPNTKRQSRAGEKTPKTRSPVKRAHSNSASKESTVTKAAPKESTVTGIKLRRSAAHRGVPVPEKMRKLMEKFKK